MDQQPKQPPNQVVKNKHKQLIVYGTVGFIVLSMIAGFAVNMLYSSCFTEPGELAPDSDDCSINSLVGGFAIQIVLGMIQLGVGATVIILLIRHRSKQRELTNHHQPPNEDNQQA